jgi:adenylate cyclase, class 2
MAGSAPTETELKIPVPDLDAVRARLEAAGGVRQGGVEQERNLLFDTPERSLTAAGHALRLRRSGGRFLLTHKGPVSYRGQVKQRDELELEVADGEVMERILLRVGFTPLIRYEKERERWRVGAVEVALDHTRMGDFVEIEGRFEELGRVAAALALDPDQAVRGSYLSLWEQYRREHGELELPEDMLLPTP